MQNDEGLIHLGVHRIRCVEKVEQLVVIHLQQHAGNLASEVGVVTSEMKSGHQIPIETSGKGNQLTQQYACR